MAMSDAATILPESHIQRPVQAILDGPVASDRVGESAWVLAVEAGYVVATLGGSLVVEATLTLDAKDCAQARPRVTLAYPVDLIGTPQPTGLGPAVVFLDRLVIAMIDARSALRGRLVEETLHALVKRTLIGFKPQGIVAALIEYLLSDGFLATHCVDRHRRAVRSSSSKSL